MKALDVTKEFKWVATGIVAVAALGLPGCGKKDEPSGGTAKAPSIQRVVKIGHAAPLTGGIAHLGKDNENGVRLALGEDNAKGLNIGRGKDGFLVISRVG